MVVVRLEVCKDRLRRSPHTFSTKPQGGKSVAAASKAQQVAADGGGTQELPATTAAPGGASLVVGGPPTVTAAPVAQPRATKTPGGEISEVLARRQAMLEMQRLHDAQMTSHEAQMATAYDDTNGPADPAPYPKLRHERPLPLRGVHGATGSWRPTDSGYYAGSAAEYCQEPGRRSAEGSYRCACFFGVCNTKMYELRKRC